MKEFFITDEQIVALFPDSIKGRRVVDAVNEMTYPTKESWNKASKLMAKANEKPDNA